jgi:hypothetical protein
MFSTTALRLGLLQSERWVESHKTGADKIDRDGFIRRFEETMALENGARTALWSQRQPGQAPAASRISFTYKKRARR